MLLPSIQRCKGEVLTIIIYSNNYTSWHKDHYLYENSYQLKSFSSPFVISQHIIQFVRTKLNFSYPCKAFFFATIRLSECNSIKKYDKGSRRYTGASVYPHCAIAVSMLKLWKRLPPAISSNMGGNNLWNALPQLDGCQCSWLKKDSCHGRTISDTFALPGYSEGEQDNFDD